MAAPRKYGDELREAIHELVNEAGQPATQAATELEKRFPEIPALARIREIAREEAKARRPDPTTQPKDKQLQGLIAGVVKAIDLRLQAANHGTDDVDGAELLQLARTIREIEPLLKPEAPKGTQDNAPKGLLGQLGTTQPRRTRNPTTPQAQPVRAGVARQEGVGSGNMAA
jgi:hypothetical protein